MSRNILKSSLDNAKFSIIFQILFRCVTFILNAFVIRHVGPDVLGIMNVRLLLLESTLIFLSHEPLLKACLSDTKSHNWKQIINQIWFSLPLTCLLGFVLTFIWLNILIGTEEKYWTQYKFGCYAVCLSVIIDHVTRSVSIVAQSYCFVRLKVVLDTVYIFVRTVLFVAMIVMDPGRAIDAFSVAQVFSSIVLCVLYFGFFHWYIKGLNEGRAEGIFKDMKDFDFKSLKDFLPTLNTNESLLNRNMVLLTVSFAKQGVFKQILTEGERYVMTISPVLTFSQQSMYDIVNNLGSLAARFVFRPIEESAYFYFTQMIKREVPLKDQEEKSVQEVSQVLSQILKLVSSIGLVVVVFGNSYSYSLLYLYGGNALTESKLPTVLLQSHCFAIFFLAVNGITEGYVFATMDSKQLDRYNYLMVIFSITFLVISYIFTNIFGPVGFIMANCINMGARIAHSVHFIKKQYGGLKWNPLKGLKPDFLFSVMLIISGIMTKISEIYFMPNSIFFHILFGSVFFALTLMSWAWENQLFLRQGFEKYRRKSKSS